MVVLSFDAIRRHGQDERKKNFTTRKARGEGEGGEGVEVGRREWGLHSHTKARTSVTWRERKGGGGGGRNTKKQFDKSERKGRKVTTGRPPHGKGGEGRVEGREGERRGREGHRSAKLSAGRVLGHGLRAL